jgi:hypothetical protein
MRTIALLALLAGCMGATSPAVVGSAADVQTTPGDYVGYRVIAPCSTSGVIQFGVAGTGSTALVNIDAIAAAGATLMGKLSDIKSIWGGGGYGLVCDPGVGTEIDLDNWFDVDEVIARTGQWLHDQNLSLEVALSVESIPMAD